MTMHCGFQSIVLANSQPLNIRFLEITGAGTPIIVLHPSPLSSRFMQPLMSVLATEGNRIIAWDTPGYGDSDALPSNGGNLHEYADCLREFITGLGISSAIIYGNATGAQIAIEFSKLYPAMCERLILENCAIFTDEERADFFEHYFPDLTPRADGGHLQVAWKMVNQLFEYFPWYDTSAQARLNTPKPDLDVIQATFMDYLKAGPHYASAYKAALENERPEKLQAVSVTTDIVLWQSSMIHHYCERLRDLTLPSNIALHRADAGLAARTEQLCKILRLR
ncbi:alpha/beta fold hydrolase [Aestuariibacter sp. A3R04]|uniref:alpha/beta fold hydrolase n=1 Tax=Aestuariibacter sp. A3R04 TaxID=2841571 RepID=UPI001C08868B|nr:alpha/beta hydrolase [Aestuariibacter sp. A3R04]MBU3023532.1 alpha/beta hydrolase [Aestuariibacter sp. A3R04]